jgi:6-phosphofructokinase 2
MRDRFAEPGTLNEQSSIAMRPNNAGPAGAIVTFTPNPALDITTATERVASTHKLRCAEPRYDPGGGGINVARAIHLLGGEALAVFAAGGPTGKTLNDLLTEEGVSTHVVAIAGRTRESLAVDETATGHQYRFVMPGPLLSDAELGTCLDVLRTLDTKPDYLVASGSLPVGAPVDFYGRVAQVAKELGARMVLDTSGDALRAGIAGGGIYLLKLSRRELEALTGKNLPRAENQADAAASLIENGQAEIVVVSLGENGALLVTRDPVRSYPAISVPVRSTIGAGDAMVAGIVLALARGWSLDESMHFGLATASAALLRLGNELCRREDAERLYAQSRKAIGIAR